jgi:hypothetical protein
VSTGPGCARPPPRTRDGPAPVDGRPGLGTDAAARPGRGNDSPAAVLVSTWLPTPPCWPCTPRSAAAR